MTRIDVPAVLACCCALLWLGLMSLWPTVANVSAVAAVVLGVVALVRTSNSGDRPYGTGIAVAGILLPLVVIVFNTPIYYKEWDRTRPSCHDNMRHISRAMFMYAEDYDESYPPAERWQDALRPYLKSDWRFVCPSTSAAEPTYAMNIALDGRKMRDIKSPTSMIAFFDSVPGKNLAGGPELLPKESRHNGRYFNFVFADGHVKHCSVAKPGSPMTWQE